MEQKKLERFVCNRAIREIREIIENAHYVNNKNRYVKYLLDNIKEIEIDDAEIIYDGSITLTKFKIGTETFVSKENVEKRILEEEKRINQSLARKAENERRKVCLMPESLIRFFGRAIPQKYDIESELRQGIKYRYIIIMEETLLKYDLTKYNCDYCFVYGYKANHQTPKANFPIIYDTDNIVRMIQNYEIDASLRS